MDIKDKILQDIVLGVTETSEIIDKATSWSMAGVGASILFIFSKLQDFIFEFGECKIQVVLSLLLTALSFGIIAKILFVKISTKSKIIREVQKCMEGEHKGAPLEDLEFALGIVQNDIQRWYIRLYRKLMIKIFKSQVNINDLPIKIGKSYNAQIEFSFLMALMIVISIGFIIVNQ